MIYKYNTGQRDDPLNTDQEMILSWETLAYQWIIAEVFYSDEEFAKPTCNSCITLVCVACVFDRHRFRNKKLVPQNDGLKNVFFKI